MSGQCIVCQRNSSACLCKVSIQHVFADLTQRLLLLPLCEQLLLFGSINFHSMSPEIICLLPLDLPLECLRFGYSYHVLLSTISHARSHVLFLTSQFGSSRFGRRDVTLQSNDPDPFCILL